MKMDGIFGSICRNKKNKMINAIFTVTLRLCSIARNFQRSRCIVTNTENSENTKNKPIKHSHINRNRALHGGDCVVAHQRHMPSILREAERSIDNAMNFNSTSRDLDG